LEKEMKKLNVDKLSFFLETIKKEILD